MTDFQPGWPCVPAGSNPPSVADRLSAPAAADLLPQVLALTPRGPAWGTDEAGDGRGASPVMLQFWQAIAGWSAASYATDFTLALQALPSAVTWALPDWEAELGLPDPCIGEPPDTAGRIAALGARYAAFGGQSPNYYICLGQALGTPVCLVEEFASARIGMRLGDRSAILYARIGAHIGDPLDSEANPGLDRRARLWGPAWDYAWRVHADPVPVTHAVIGARIGDALAVWGDKTLECAVRRAMPAHTVVLFAYDGCADRLDADDGTTGLLGDDGTPLLAH